MLFERYGDMLTRLEELGARVGELNNRDRQVMQNLLEEQEWLNTTLVKRAKFLLEEIDRGFEKLFDWMISYSDLIDRTNGHGGTPGDVIRLERMMQEADDLREQLNRMMPRHDQIEDVPMFLTVEAQENPVEGSGAGVLELQAPGRQTNLTRLETASAEMFTPPPTVEVSMGATAPGPVLQKVRKKGHKKDRKKKAPNVQPNYTPPKELVQSLEEKMAAACRSPNKPNNPRIV